jgi:hypothetical protein
MLQQTETNKGARERGKRRRTLPSDGRRQGAETDGTAERVAEGSSRLQIRPSSRIEINVADEPFYVVVHIEHPTNGNCIFCYH